MPNAGRMVEWASQLSGNPEVVSSNPIGNAYTGKSHILISLLSYAEHITSLYPSTHHTNLTNPPIPIFRK